MAYQIKLSGAKPRATRYATQQQAYDAALELANETGESVTVIDAQTFPRAKSLGKTVHAGTKRRVSIPVAREASAANKKRPQRLPSKAEALSSLFKKNPTAAAYAKAGDYWFAHPFSGALIVGRSLAEMTKKAQALATQSGKRVSVNYQETSRDNSLRFKGKPKVMRKNPAPRKTYSHGWAVSWNTRNGSHVEQTGKASDETKARKSAAAYAAKLRKYAKKDGDTNITERVYEIRS